MICLKDYFPWVFRALLPILLLGAVLLDVSPAQALTLTYATYTASKGLRGHAEKGFIDALEKVSHGKIKVVPYWGGSILKGDEILDGVKNGVADMGIVNINYYPNKLILNSVFQMFPVGPDDYHKKMDIYEKIYKNIPALTNEFTKSNQRIVYRYTVLPISAVFRKPIESIKDFKGRRVRAPSEWMLNMLAGLGAIPVSIPWSDVYQSLQTGAIDGVFTNLDSMHRIGLDQIAPHIFVTRKLWTSVPYSITINENKWNSLPKNIKQMFKKASKLASKKFAKYYKSRFKGILNEERKSGDQVVFATDKDIRYYKSLQAVKINRKKWVKQAANLGADHPKMILDKVTKILNSSKNN
jgi:TRAP-type C4-dicarboxylate transport system substrate-binding protein